MASSSSDSLPRDEKQENVPHFKTPLWGERGGCILSSGWLAGCPKKMPKKMSWGISDGSKDCLTKVGKKVIFEVRFTTHIPHLRCNPLILFGTTFWINRDLVKNIRNL